MRVSIDARYVRERPSGIGAYVSALIERLPGLAPRDHFHLWRDPRAPTRLSAAPNVSHTEVAAAANSLGTLAWPSRLAPLGGVDVLHAPFNLLGRGLRCAAVTTVHDLMWLTAPHLCETPTVLTPVFRRFYSDGLRRALRRSERIIAISSATADAIRLVAPDASPRVRVIPHGVAERFRPAVSREAARLKARTLVGSDGEYLLVVGQNSPSKNHAAVLEAFAAADLPRDTRLVLLQRLYQNGRFGLSRRSTLAPLAERLGISDRVIWLSALSDRDVLTLLQGARALIQFSRYEGFGMPALEAMACGTPVISSDIAPLVEVLGGAGRVVPLRIDALASALADVGRNDGIRDELSGRGLERAAAFSWDRCAEAHLAVYEEAARS